MVACPPAFAQAQPPLKIIAFGDSLTAGAGLPAGQSFPSVLQKKLQEAGYNVIVVNAGVSGDTSSGGLARLEWTLGEGADGIILELGANDMLRGINPEVTKRALDTILAKLKSRGIQPLIAGMRANPSLGKEYQTQFDEMYPQLAKKYNALLYPFFMEGVAGNLALQLPDRLHPNAAGVEHIVEGILPTVKNFIEQLSEQAAAKQKQ